VAVALWATQTTNLASEYASASHSEAATTACGVAGYTSIGAEPAYNDILPADFCLMPQRGDKFGERLFFAVEDLFKQLCFPQPSTDSRVVAQQTLRSGAKADQFFTFKMSNSLLAKLSEFRSDSVRLSD